MNKSYDCYLYKDLLPLHGTGELHESTEEWMELHKKHCKCHLALPPEPEDAFAIATNPQHPAEINPRFIMRLRKWATSFIVIALLSSIGLGIILGSIVRHYMPEISEEEAHNIARNSVFIEEGQKRSQVKSSYQILRKEFHVFVYLHSTEYTQNDEQPVIYTIEEHRVVIDGKTGRVISVSFSNNIDPLTGKKIGKDR